MMHLTYAALTALALTMIAPSALAQTPPPAATETSSAAVPPPATSPVLPAAQPPYLPPGYAPAPPGYAPAPPGYAPAPQGYASPGGYAYPPAYQYRPAAPRPQYLPYRDGALVPDGYHVGTRLNKTLIIAGASTFGGSYLISVAGAAAARGGETDVMYVPIVGPFILAGRIDFQRSGEFADLSNFFAGLGVILLVADGITQLGGATMLAVGLTHEKPALVRDNVPKSTMHVVPLTMANGTMGIGLVGTM